MMRILETLLSYNARKERESVDREEARKRDMDMRRRLEASGTPNGIACPVCHHEMGDIGCGYPGIKWEGDPLWKEYRLNRGVMCPRCGYEGFRIECHEDPKYTKAAD